MGRWVDVGFCDGGCWLEFFVLILSWLEELLDSSLCFPGASI